MPEGRAVVEDDVGADGVVASPVRFGPPGITGPGSEIGAGPVLEVAVPGGVPAGDPAVPAPPGLTAEDPVPPLVADVAALPLVALPVVAPDEPEAAEPPELPEPPLPPL